MKNSVSDKIIVDAATQISERYGYKFRPFDILIESILQANPDIAQGPRKDNPRGIIRSLADTISARISNGLGDTIKREKGEWMLKKIEVVVEELKFSFKTEYTEEALKQLTTRWAGSRKSFSYAHIADEVLKLYPALKNRKQLDGIMDSLYDTVSSHCTKSTKIKYSDGKACLKED